MPDALHFDLTATQNGGKWLVELRQQPGDQGPGQSRKDYALSRASLMTEVFKALLLINGGGAIALLAFLKEVATSQNEVYRQLVVPAAFGAMLMGAGLLSAVISALFRFQHSREAESMQYKEAKASVCRTKLFQWLYQLALVVSALCFAAAAVWVGLSTLKTLL